MNPYGLMLVSCSSTFYIFSVEGYSIVWDNVGKIVQRAQQTSDQRNSYELFAMTLLVKNRISFRHMEFDSYERKEAVTITPATFLPQQCDWDELRGRLQVLVSRILVQHMHELLQPGGWVVTSTRIWCQVAHRDLHKLASIVER